MLICQDLQEMPALVSRLKALNLDLAINQSSEDYLEITSSTAEKSRGVEYVKQLEALAKEEMAAFGDGFNDVAMLQEVAWPIVMENALPGVKKYGRYLTKDNDHDGVAYGIETFLQNR
jgi:Predicted hydrolases of the HAD superfamily